MRTNQTALCFICLALSFLMCSCMSMAQQGALAGAASAYERRQYERALVKISQAEKYAEIPEADRPELALLKASCYHCLGQALDAVGLYQCIVERLPDTEAAYRARARLQQLDKLEQIEQSTAPPRGR